MKNKPQVRRSPTGQAWPSSAVSEAERLNRWTGDPSFMLSLARGLLVLHSIADAGRSVSISEIAASTGLSRATVRRCIYTLNALRYVNAERGGSEPGPRFAAMTAAHLESSPLMSSAKTVLDALRQRLGQTVSLGVRENFEAVYIYESHAPDTFQLHVPVGVRVAMYCTSVGRILLAAMSDELLEEYLSTVDRFQLTEFTTTDKSKLLEAIEDVRKKGYSIVDQEVEVGLRSLSVPVTGRRGEVVAAISVGTHRAITGPRELRSKFLPQMQAAAEQLSSVSP